MAHRSARLAFAAVLASFHCLFFPFPAGAQAVVLLHACVHNTTGQVRFVDPDRPCTNTETRLTLNAAGSPGERGEKGDKGDPGPKGDPGAGLDTGVISGVATSCQGPLAGAMVYIPGRSFVSVANALGGFELSYVPPGNHNVTVEAVTGAKRSFPGVAVNTGETTALGTVSIVDITSDVSNCGACGNACPAGQACTGGQCILNCPAGTVNCNGSCVNLGSSFGNCGACGRSCAANQACSGGSCTCQNGFSDCDQNPANGCEADLRSPTTCGSCFNNCGPRDCSPSVGGSTCTLRAPGAPCTSGGQCTTGTCFGGICQGNVTCGTCYYSTNYNTSCSPYSRGTYDSRCGGNGLVCTGSGSACLIASGYSCSLGGTPCLSGLCEYHFPSGFYCR